MIINDKKYFFLLGFQKSGTSSIHEWLKQINSIALPNIKETHYFSKNSNFNNGINWYFDHYKITNKTTHIGEIDPSYINNKESLLKIKRIFKNKPKFIFILRKPIDRAYSHYLMAKLRGHEKLNFNNSLNIEHERLASDNTDFSLINNGYFERSLYYKYIEMFYDVFPDSKPLFLKFEDIYSKTKKVEMFINIIKYLNIDCDISNINLDKIVNKASKPKSLYLQKILYNEFMIKRLLKNILPYKLVVKLKLYLSNINMSKIKNNYSHKEINLVDDKFLHLNDEITNKMEKIIDLDLSDWYCLK